MLYYHDPVDQFPYITQLAYFYDGLRVGAIQRSLLDCLVVINPEHEATNIVHCQSSCVVFKQTTLSRSASSVMLTSSNMPEQFQ